MSQDIIVVSTPISNDVIGQLIIADEYDPNITPIINVFFDSLRNKGIEVFLIGHLFLVTEEEIYIGVYEDDIEDPNPDEQIPCYDKEY